MSHPDLRELLSQLHARLGAAQSLDEDDRKHLSSALGDISKALASTPGSNAPPKPRLEALAVKFEADHPGIATGLRELIDLLGKAGI